MTKTTTAAAAADSETPLCGSPPFCPRHAVSRKVKELPTYKDVDFRNNLQKVYVSAEEKEKVLDKLHRDVEVNLVH